MKNQHLRHTNKKIGALISFTLVIVLCTSQKLHAQFTVSAELRPRLEIRDGFMTLPTPDSKPAIFVSQRSRLNIGYAQKKFSLRVSLQDVRVWGDEEQVKDIAGVAVHEAYGQIQFSDKIFLRAGRQELVYDDERLLGNSNWNQPGRSHDAALLRYADKGWTADVAGAFSQQQENLFGTDYTLNTYKVLSFARVSKTIENKYKAVALFIADGFQGTDSTKDLFMRYTYGVNGEYHFGSVKLVGIFYDQSGTDVSNKSISAYLFSLQAYQNSKKFMAGIGDDYLSGNNALDPSDHKFRTFNTLYATNHPLYGHIDYFSNIPADTKNGGLMDAYAKLKYIFNDKAAIYLDYHYFSLTGKVADPEIADKTINSYLGSEVDLWFIYKITDGLELRPGISQMFATESMNVLKGGGKALSGTWGYVQLTFTPTLFRSEQK
ncbi:MAG TPA: alginate export family protein [Chitinophagales bacterium]|nr:alginate export family protein [Chitinophagales bacterium]